MTSQKSSSEEAIIQGHFASLAQGFPGALGLRDDCASIAPSAGSELIVTTDALREGIHYFADDPPADVGWKALAVNVSDLAAKGAKPLGYVMALSFPCLPDDQWLRGFTAGLNKAQQAFGMHLIGGDTDRAPGPVSIVLTAFGTVPSGQMLRRDGARAGDLLFVTGTLGDSALGLLLRQHDEGALSWQIADAERHYLIDRYLRPRPVVGLRQALLDHASAAMDLSDGLMKDAGRLAQASGTALTMRFADLPLSAAAAGVIASDPGLCSAIVAGGDDYELLVAVPPQRAAGFKQLARAAAVAVTRIGEVNDGAGLTLAKSDGQPMQLEEPGWDHF